MHSLTSPFYYILIGFLHTVDTLASKKISKSELNQHKSDKNFQEKHK